MIRSFLFLLLSATSVYGQDTLAVAQPKFGVGDTETSFVGDTILVRLMFDKQKSARQGSEAAWYNTNGKITDVDLLEFKKFDIMGIKKYHDSLYYYVGKEDGKKGDVALFASRGLGPVKALPSFAIAGIAIRGFARGDNFLVITWEQKSQVVHLYEFNRHRIVSEKKLQLAVALKNIKATEIAFPAPGEPGRISVMSTTLRFFLHGNTFAAVYDIPGTLLSSAGENKFKTGITRLDLSTGKETNQDIFTDNTYAFKSFLYGPDRLYRLVIEKEAVIINIHDLDQDNKIIGTYPINIPKKEEIATRRLGALHQVMRARMQDMTGMHAKENIDVGIIVDEYNNEQMISLGVINNMQGGPPVPSAPATVAVLAFAIATTALVQLKDDPNNLLYVYLKGTPETGYKLLRENEATDFLKVRIDNFEFDAQKKGEVDYWAHFTGKKYCVSVHSYKNSPRYIITKFLLQP